MKPFAVLLGLLAGLMTSCATPSEPGVARPAGTGSPAGLVVASFIEASP